MSDRVLVTGGTGKTGQRVATLLAGRGVEARVAMRLPRQPGQVRFDWRDAGTFNDALDGVGAAYLVAPTDDLDILPAMQPFLERALERGLGRLVLLSASSLEEGGPMMGAVHAWLRAEAPAWSVLRPTWFMQNFTEHQHAHTIREAGAIYSATGDGRVTFIDAEDIAAVAAEALAGPGLPNGDLVLTGPEALSYGAVADLIAAAVGRPVRHHRLSVPEMAQRFEQVGLPAGYAAALAAMDGAIAEGSENRVTGEVERVVGRPPTSFAAFAADHAATWG